MLWQAPIDMHANLEFSLEAGSSCGLRNNTRCVSDSLVMILLRQISFVKWYEIMFLCIRNVSISLPSTHAMTHLLVACVKRRSVHNMQVFVHLPAHLSIEMCTLGIYDEIVSALRNTDSGGNSDIVWAYPACRIMPWASITKVAGICMTSP